MLTVALLCADVATVNLSLSQLENIVYETPSGQEIKMPKNTKLIIIAFEKDTGALINEYLDTKSALYLEINNSVFIADVNKMPKIIAKIVALPKLQKYKHPIYLSYGEELEKIVPKIEAKITLLYIENEKIEDIKYISTSEDLKMAIER